MAKDFAELKATRAEQFAHLKRIAPVHGGKRTKTVVRQALRASGYDELANRLRNLSESARQRMTRRIQSYSVDGRPMGE